MLAPGIVLKDLGSATKGLSTQEVGLRIGLLEKPSKKKFTVFRTFFTEFRNPLVLILLVAATLSYGFGEYVDGTVVLTIVLASTILNFVQESKARKAADLLKSRLKSKARVRRGGRELVIRAEELVVGDIVLLKAGDLIPADARILSQDDLFVNQSALTGESLPSEKNAEVMGTAESLSEINNMVYAGTSVISGRAEVVVTAVGKQSEFGKIAKQLEKEIPSSFKLGISTFSHLILKATIFIVCAVFFINALQQKDILSSFMFAIAVAVGLTPELLPMILSITMSRGAIRMAKSGVLVKTLGSIPSLGSMDILCTDKTGTLTKDKIAVVKYMSWDGNESDDVFLSAYLTSSFQTSMENPLDQAILEYKEMDLSAYKKIEEIPFDFQRRRMSVVSAMNEHYVLHVKGAPEEIFKIAKEFVGGKDKHTDIDKATALYADLSREGYRVLAVAQRTLKDKRNTYKVEDEREVTLLGFIAFLDPPKDDVGEVVKELEAKGIRIKIITGDNELVTQKICADLGMKVQGVLLGKELQSMTDDALMARVERTTIFARFSPSDKNRVIHALRSKGHTVGYMGDGINDAPSLVGADVGISVENAVDVAKESADMVLMKKSLRLLLEGVVEGRKTFVNSMKYIMMGVSSNFGNMFSILGAILYLPYLPMLPIQILLNNLLYDTAQITLPGDRVDEEEIAKPQKWDMKFIKRFMITFGFISSMFDFLTFYILFGVFHLDSVAFHTGWFLESLATQTLIIFVIRTRRVPFFKSTPNPALLATGLGVLGLAWLLPFSPLAMVFGFTTLPLQVLGSIVLIVLSYLVVVELGKKVFYRVKRG